MTLWDKLKEKDTKAKKERKSVGLKDLLKSDNKGSLFSKMLQTEIDNKPKHILLQNYNIFDLNFIQ